MFSMPRWVGQSATPATSWALALIRPIERAASGSLRMIMNTPLTTGRIRNPSPVSSVTVERRAFKNSAHNAD